MSALPRRLAALLLLVLVVAPLGQRPAAQAATVARSQPDQTPVTLAPFVESEGAGAVNNTPQSASTVGSTTERSWSQRIQGTIGSAGDVDYFAFTLSQPASSVKLSLDGLSADYDLILAGQPDASQAFDPGQPGLENVTQVGGTIAAIGGTIAAIGGTIAAIGGTIAAISVNGGNTAEQIDTFLWLPGTYYAVVTTSNGDFGSTPYTLTLRVDGSGLDVPPPAPEVELRLSRPFWAAPEDITTLYVVDTARLRALYGRTSDTQVLSITRALQRLTGQFQSPPDAGNGPEFGVVLDLATLRGQLGNTQTMTDVYSLWQSKAGNPLAANYVAGLIDNVIEAATTDGRSGDTVGPAPATPFFLGSSSTIPLIRFPNVRNVVLVGGDEVIPGFRLPDLTTIANEADYAAYLRQIDPTGVIGPSNPQGAALRYRMITSDNPYGSDRPYRFYGFPFFAPRLAVGRLVETPGEIANYLDNYSYIGEFSFLLTNFTVDVTGDFETKEAVVTGYDFLKDQATVISDTLASTGLYSTSTEYNGLSTLINDEWTSVELADVWFDGPIDELFPADASNDPLFSESQIKLSSINAHFDHWQVLPARDTNGNFPARRLLTPGYTADRFSAGVPGGYFRNTLGYSVGCHSGYNVIGRSIVQGTTNAPLYEADFAQAINRHAGNWIGNTGYGYGTVDGIDYTERLATLYTEELARDVRGGDDVYVGQSIGVAHRNAKLRYLRNATALSPYDFKALHIWTLYGLPYIRAIVGEPVNPPPEERQPDTGSVQLPSPPPPAETQAPYGPDALGRLTRIVTFTLSITDPNDLLLIPRTGSTILELDPSDIKVQDEFVQRGGGNFPQPQVRILSGNQIGAPILPAFGYDLSATSNLSETQRLQVKDVVFIGGSYGQLAGFNPQITTVATETVDPLVNMADEPAFTAGVGIWYPDKFFNFSSVGEGTEQRDQLVTAAAQFRADPGGTRGLIRPYARMVFKVIYDDPGLVTQQARTIRADELPPVIESVEIEFQRQQTNQPAQTGQAVVVVRAFDASPTEGQPSGIDPADISAVYVRNGNQWESVSFTRRETGIYTATLPVGQGDVRVIVRVTDRAGNTTYYTAKGSFQPPAELIRVGLPLLRR